MTMTAYGGLPCEYHGCNRLVARKMVTARSTNPAPRVLMTGNFPSEPIPAPIFMTSSARSPSWTSLRRAPRPAATSERTRRSLASQTSARRRLVAVHLFKIRPTPRLPDGCHGI